MKIKKETQTRQPVIYVGSQGGVGLKCLLPAVQTDFFVVSVSQIIGVLRLRIED